MTNNWTAQESERSLIIQNCLGWEGLRFNTLNNVEQEKYWLYTRLLELPSDKFKPQFNELILFLQNVKLTSDKIKILKGGWAISEYMQMNAVIQKKIEN